MYALLNSADMLNIRHDRLLELERSHYRTTLRLAEMNALEVPADAPGRQQLEHDLSTIEMTIEWHRASLGIEPEPGPRVVGDPVPPTGDDGAASNHQPVGEEAPGDGTDGSRL